MQAILGVFIHKSRIFACHTLALFRWLRISVSHWQLQQNQEAIGWDNLLRGKFANDWKKLNGVYNRKLKDIQQQKEKVQRNRIK